MSFLLVDMTHLQRPTREVTLSRFDGEKLVEFIQQGYAVHTNSVIGRLRAAEDEKKARLRLVQPN